MSNIGSRVPTGTGQSLTVSREGLLSLPDGAKADLTTAEGMAKAKAVLSNAELAEIELLMKAIGYKVAAGVYVADDSYKVAQGPSLAAGPQSVSDGATDLDEQLGQAFTAAGVANPYNANTTAALQKKLASMAVYGEAVTATRTYLQNPTPQNEAAAVRANGSLVNQPGINVMEALFLVFRESIKENNEDKKYFLRKLQDFNTMAKQLSEYLHELVDASSRLSQAGKGSEEPDKVFIDVEVKNFDLSTLDGDGKLISTSKSESVNRASLSDRIKDLEAMQEEVRNKRQMATTAFQNFDQKGNQMMNLLAAVVKTMNEMRSIGAGSRSGL